MLNKAFPSFVTAAVLSFLMLARPSAAYPQGPPVYISGVCQSMTPQHPVLNGTGYYQAETSAPPYKLTFDSNCYKPGQAVIGSINGTTNVNFTGFFIQARQNGANTASYGTFDTVNGDSGVQALSCFGQTNNAVGHNNPDETDWSFKQFKWTPSSSQSGDIQFVATIVEEEDEFWIGYTVKLSQCAGATIIKMNAIFLSSVLIFYWLLSS